MSFSSVKLITLSEIVRDIGQVLFATVLVSPLVNGIADVSLVVFGSIMSVSAWSLSLILVG